MSGSDLPPLDVRFEVTVNGLPVEHFNLEDLGDEYTIQAAARTAVEKAALQYGVERVREGGETFTLEDVKALRDAIETHPVISLRVRLATLLEKVEKRLPTSEVVREALE